MDQIGNEFDLRIASLERRLELFQVICGVMVVILAVGVVYLTLQSRSNNRGTAGVLRVKGLIVEDAAGRDRILIGAPVPSVSDRKRHDDTIGLIVLGENGADRLALAAPTPEPQIHGVIGKRIGGQAGFIVDDEDGDERGGFGVLDNDGRVSLGLDYPHGTAEAISLGVLPGENNIEIHDSTSVIRAAFLQRKNSTPIMYGLNLLSSARADMGILRLDPYGLKHVVIKANDESLNKALDDMSMK